MKLLARTAALILAAGIAASAHATTAPQDTLMKALEESKASGRGLNFYVNGQAIPGVVVDIQERYLIARSQAQGIIIIRLDRLDGVAGFLSQPATERKSQ